MDRNFVGSGPRARVIVALAFLVGAVLLGLAAGGLAGGHVGAGSGPAYLPVQFVPQPTPTPGPPPQFVTNIPLNNAQCPNAAAYHPVTGYLYVVNNYSYNVSVLKERQYLADIPTGEWPTGIAVDPGSTRAWVTNLHTGVSVLDGGQQVALVPRDYEPYGVAFNPTNGYTYVTDLDSKIQIINGTELVMTLKLTDPQTGKNAGWMRPIVVDSRTGLVYAASWDYGRLYVLQGTAVINSVFLGWGPLNMAIDEARGLLYVAHSEPNQTYPHDISVVDLTTLQVTPILSMPGEINRARDVVVEARSGLAYVSNPDDNSVTVLQGTQVMGIVPVGERPWGLGLNPNNGTVFVANRDSRSVSILRNGALLATEAVFGEDPYAISVDTAQNDIYVLNRGKEFGTFRCKNASVSILH